MSRKFGAATTDKISIGNPSHLSNVIPVTYAAWVNATGYGNPSAGRILAKDDASGVGHALFLSSGSGGQVTAQVSRGTTDATAVVAYPAGFVGAAIWKFVVML